MTPNTHRVLAVYVLIKSVVPKVPWSVVNNLSWTLSLEKNPLPCQRHVKNAMVLPSIVRGRSHNHAIVKWASLLRSNKPLCSKSNIGLASQVAHYNDEWLGSLIILPSSDFPDYINHSC